MSRRRWGRSCDQSHTELSLHIPSRAPPTCIAIHPHNASVVASLADGHVVVLAAGSTMHGMARHY